MDGLTTVETLLRDRIREEESLYGRRQKETDSLWSHLQRVAGIAERIGTAEGVDPIACRLAGLFHDAGKFRAGTYHEGDVAEEEHSVEVLAELARSVTLDPRLVDEVSGAILQLYRDDSLTSPLARVLFDSDNLDKLGLLGMANYFVKTGLRGGGFSERTLYSLTVELTYARHAGQAMATGTGQELATRRAAQTTTFIHELLASLREDGVCDFRASQESFEGLVIDVVAPAACRCGGELKRRLWGKEGVKCDEIHLEHVCERCDAGHEFRFCRPRLMST